MALTERTHEIIRSHFLHKPMQCAVDATCGNGHDTLFLLESGFARVFSFDIQAVALEQTRAKLSNEQGLVTQLIFASHEQLDQHVNQAIDCAMFNLGYLPGGDKTLTTQASSSVSALEQTAARLSQHGLITIMCYPGHPAGKDEADALLVWFDSISDTYQVETHLASAPKPTAPVLYTIRKK